jgi:hypothetical protein
VDNAQVLAIAVGFAMRVSESSGDAAGDENGQFLGQYPAFFPATAERIAPDLRHGLTPSL